MCVKKDQLSCMFCGVGISWIGTQKCDSCWNMLKHIWSFYNSHSIAPQAAEKILNYVKETAKTKHLTRWTP